ncbi:FAD-dependent oxidoreductase [Chloroflexota bacterium]
MITEVYQDKCTGCGSCFGQCPLDVFRLDAWQEQSPPCQVACPAGVDIRGYMYLMKMGMAEEALELMRETLPLPAVTGRVCFHPCEAECARKKVDEAVSINAIERYVGDYKEKAQPVPGVHFAKVAVIGSGPAGLSAAYYLVGMGYPVTVFEAMPKMGGMLRYGIPEYRLPRKVLDTQIKYIADMGAEFQGGVTLGKNITIAGLKDKGYRAIFIAVGTQKNVKIGLPGEDTTGVYHSLDFLKDVNSGKRVKVGKKLVVIGGGNAAIDAARTALRLGAKDVSIIYRRSKKEMPASKVEVEAALAEGVKMRLLTAPSKIISKNGKVAGIECVRTTLGKKDASGRKTPLAVKGSKFVVNADMVIPAIGEAPDTGWAKGEKLAVTKEGRLKVDKVLYTGIDGVFAGGDVVNGATSVIKAIASGRKAAEVIDLYLRDHDIKSYQEETLIKVKKLPGKGMEKIDRQPAPMLNTDERVTSFAEANKGFNEEMMLDEIRRCMTCGAKAFIAYPEDCMTCYTCEMKCQHEALYVHPFKEILPMAIK